MSYIPQSCMWFENRTFQRSSLILDKNKNSFEPSLKSVGGGLTVSWLPNNCNRKWWCMSWCILYAISLRFSHSSASSFVQHPSNILKIPYRTSCLLFDHVEQIHSRLCLSSLIHCHYLHIWPTRSDFLSWGDPFPTYCNNCTLVSTSKLLTEAHLLFNVFQEFFIDTGTV